MTTAILCPGPSLISTFDRQRGYDLRLAVNRGVFLTPCDWWVALDAESVKTLPVAIPPKWLTTDEATRHITPPAGVTVQTVESWFARVPADIGGCSWCTFSMTAAMMAAYRSGATAIDLYGYDATDAPDFDGHRPPTTQRNAQRWEHEALCYRLMCDWLLARNCTVNRIRP